MPEPSAAPSLVPITLAFLHESFRRSAACRGRLPARDGALHVVNAGCLPVGIAEIKLAQIPLQVGFRNMLVHTVDAPLQVRKIELAELLSESWVLDSPNTDFVAMQAGVFRAAGLDPPRLTVEATSIILRNELLATQRFLTVVVSFSLLLPRKHPGLKALPVKLPDIRQPVGITTLKNRSLSPVAQMFIESVRELVKPLANRR